MSSADILLIDVGNSRIKWATLTAKGLRDSASAAHEQGGLDAIANTVWAKLARPVRVVVSNVAGLEFADRLTACSERLWQVELEFIVPQHSACGVINAYTDPRKLGSDRWVAMIGAYHATPQAVCIVDCGTAITIDALSATGEHLGGLILPGLNLMRRALIANTSGLAGASQPLDHQTGELCALARDSAGALTNGTLYAVVAAIDRILAELAATLDSATTIISGGDAERILPLLKTPCRHQPDLVLQGLAIIARGE